MYKIGIRRGTNGNIGDSLCIMYYDLPTTIWQWRHDVKYCVIIVCDNIERRYVHALGMIFTQPPRYIV